MKVFLLDNGLVGFGAHNFHVDVAIAKAFSDRGFECSVFGARAAQPAVLFPLNAAPHFSRYFYESLLLPGVDQIPSFLWHKITASPGQSPHDEALSERASQRRLNRAYRRDMDRLPAGCWERENLIIVPAISQNQILGLVSFLRSLPPANRPAVLCQLMFAPEWTPWGGRATYGERYYRQAFALAAPLIGKSLFFAAETAALAEDYAQRFDIHPMVLPLPLAGPELRSQEHAPDAMPLLAYLGYSKTERGFHLLPHAIEQINRTHNVRFLVQVQHSGWEEDVIAAERRLRSIGNVELVEGELDRAVYTRCLARADVILLPYDARSYCERGSGVLVEAGASGSPIVTSDNTWGANLIKAGEIEGELFASFDAPSLAGAIERLLDRLPSARQNARARAPSFAARHSPENYADTLLNLVQRNHEQAGGQHR